MKTPFQSRQQNLGKYPRRPIEKQNGGDTSAGFCLSSLGSRRDALATPGDTRDTHQTAPDLDTLILAAARAYYFTDDDLVRVREVAKRDPVGMRECYLAMPLVRAQLAILSNPPQPRQTPAPAPAGHTPEPVSKGPDMKLAELLPSSYLKKEDFPTPALLTIDRLERVNVAQEGQPAEYKWALHFLELERPLVLNSTNIQTLGAICGDDTDAWPGRKVVAYHDPSVSFGGKLVGGIRLRAPKQQAQQQAAAAPASAAAMADLEDDLPF